MRTFIAINFDEDVKKYIQSISGRIKENCKKGNFVDESNYHLTVRFIGEVDKEEIGNICLAMDEALSSIKSFKLTLRGIGFFKRGFKSIVWVGLQDSKILNIAHSRLEKSLQKQGFSRDRQGLSPHITLAREAELKKGYDEIKKEIGFQEKEIDVTSIALMESKRIGSKLVYTPLYVKKLK